MDRNTRVIVALTTVASEDAARDLVKGLIDDRLIACGTIVSKGTSIFRWEGAVTDETEFVVLMKTRLECWDELQAAVEERHPYELPELLALPVEVGSPRYLQWVAEETR